MFSAALFIFIRIRSDLEMLDPGPHLNQCGSETLESGTLACRYLCRRMLNIDSHQLSPHSLLEVVVAMVHNSSYFHKFNPGVDRWQLLATHTSKSLCEPDMRISMFNCDVSQTLSAINSAADSIKIISTDLWIFLIVLQ
jgi:hypothetical protein